MKNRPASLHRRLALSLTLTLALLWLVAVVLGALVVRHEMNEVFDSALKESGQRILTLGTVEILNREDAELSQQLPALRAHDEYLTYVIQDADGTTRLQSHDAEPEHFPRNAPAEGHFSTARHRIYTTSTLQDQYTLLIAEPLAHRREALLETAGTLLWPLLLLIPLSLGAVWLLVRSSLRPLVSYRRELEARGAGDLSLISTEAMPTELAPTAVSVNRLLERLRRTLEAERGFIANSAHELRTPLASALAQLERLDGELPDETHRARGRRIEATLRGLARVSEKLIQLAKAEGGGLLADEPGDLVPILELVVDDFRDTAAGIRLHRPPDVVLSHLDPDAFAILLRNLVDNAVRHGDPGQPVEVALSTAGELRVVNSCAPLQPSALEHLRERFVRAREEGEGSGLGLAIADAIVTGAGLRMRLNSPATAREDGFEVVVAGLSGR